MRIFLMIGLFMASPVFCLADVTVAKQISTGKIIEMQSAARPGTLIDNAVNAGFDKADVAEEVISVDDYKSRLSRQEWGKDLAAAKTRRIKEIKKEARRIMAEHTDWYVIRKAENGTAIPAAVQSYRATMRQATNDAETAINALTTIEAVRDYKPTWPDAPGE
jgi:hypothetical protein